MDSDFTIEFGHNGVAFHFSRKETVCVSHGSIENVSEKAIAQTKVVQVTGARQTGKTTVVQKNFPDYH